MSIHILTDSAADFSQEQLRTYRITQVPMQVIFGTESMSADELTQEAFWTRLLAGEIGTTSQPSPDAFLTAFTNLLGPDDELIYIGVSTALSGTVQSATIAASMLDAKRIHIVDSLSATGGQMMLALHACHLRDEGKMSAKEIVEALTALRGRIRVYATLDTLANLARSGRISKAAAGIGSLARLKPQVRITPEGTVDICGKAMGRHRAIDSVVKAVESHRIDPNFPIIPLYTYHTDNCEALMARIREDGCASRELAFCSLGPTLSTHIGPNAFGITFVEAE